MRCSHMGHKLVLCAPEEDTDLMERPVILVPSIGPSSTPSERGRTQIKAGAPLLL